MSLQDSIFCLESQRKKIVKIHTCPYKFRQSHGSVKYEPRVFNPPDTMQLTKAPRIIFRFRRQETLIIVTADHGHVMTMSGYAERDTPVSSVVKAKDAAEDVDDDGMPYAVVNYANGPGFHEHLAVAEGGENVTRVDPTFIKDVSVE